MTERPTYLLHGLRVRSDLPLAAPTVAGAECDIEVELGAEAGVPYTRPDGRVLAELRLPSGPTSAETEHTPGRAEARSGGSTCVRTQDGYVVRFFGVCDFRVSHDLRRVSAHPDPSRGWDFASLLLTGSVLAFLLGLRGETTLHAAAASFGDQAIAVAGGPGAGKSTIAACLCAAGADLVTDDLLRFDLSPEGVRCHTGARELRLRPGAVELAGRLAEAKMTTHPDGRLAVELPLTQGRPWLKAILVPRLSREARHVSLRRLEGAEAAAAVALAPRVAGWLDRALLLRQFRDLVALARSVLVYEAEVPWRLPLSPAIAGELLQAMATDPGLIERPFAEVCA
ncbi:MAG: hypothetical protein WDA71_08790 [Actinomycetota bacterium]